MHLVKIPLWNFLRSARDHLNLGVGLSLIPKWLNFVSLFISSRYSFLFYLGITELNNILDELKLFSKDRWESFGLKAGLYQPTLDKIKAKYREDVEMCFKECLSCWLRKEDKVNEEGIPTWLRLADIVEHTRDRAMAEKIKNNHG